MPSAVDTKIEFLPLRATDAKATLLENPSYGLTVNHTEMKGKGER